MKKIFENLKKILIAVIFLISCSEETILYNEIENSEGTIKTASLPQTNISYFSPFLHFHQTQSFILVMLKIQKIYFL